MELLLQHIVNGVVSGSIYVLIALGVTLVYGLTRLINFAHGELVTIGAFTTYLLVSSGWPYAAALAGTAIIGGGTGFVLERGVFRFTRSAPINGFIVSLGLIAVSQAVLIRLTDDQPRSVHAPIAGNIELAGVQLSNQRLLVLVASVALAGGLFTYLRGTWPGRATRAFADDPVAASTLGVPLDGIVTRTFVLGGVLAALAGALAVSLYPATIHLGAGLIVKAFAVALIGGLGNPVGAVLGGLAMGLAEALGGGYVSPELADAFGFGLLLVILMVRPTGLVRGAAGAHL